jgi:Glycosyltransferase family 87
MHWFGPLPGSREARALSWMAIAVSLIICGLSIIRGFQGQTFLGRPLGGDFVQFYVAGKILNQYDPARLYDLDLEVRLQHQAAPATPSDQMLVFASAPFAGLIYRPIANLPYPWAYVAWLVFSMALYSATIVLLLRSTRLSDQQRRTGFLLAISCMPFLLESWIGGQISVLGFFAVALFLFCRARNHRFFAGFALAFALFKPTLIAIPILMLCCGRRWRMLAGVVVGAAALAVASLRTVGIRGCAAWLDTLKLYGHLATGPAAALRRTKYVDIGSFFHLLFGNASAFALVLSAMAALAGLTILALAWWRSSSWNAASRDLLWAATFSGALVCNVYTPIYDTILVAPAVAMTAGVMLSRGSQERDVFGGWLVLLYIVPWVTQSFAEFLRFQPFTLVLAGFAWWTLSWARRSAGSPIEQSKHLEGVGSGSEIGRMICQTQSTTRYQVLGASSYAVSGLTRNFGQRLSVFLRSYSPAPAILWERDR